MYKGVVIFLVSLAVLMIACSTEPLPTDVPTRTPEPTIPTIIAQTPTLVPTITPTPEPTSTSTAIPIPTAAPTLLPTPTQAPVPTAMPTPTPIPTPTPTAIPLPTSTPYPTQTPYPTYTPYPTPTLLPTPTLTVPPTSTPVPTPIPAPTTAPTDVGEWVQNDYESEDLSWKSIYLYAYETGYEEGDARLSVTCLDSPRLGKYLSVDIRWDSYVTILDDRSAHLSWNSGETEFEKWDGSSGGHRVSPQYSRNQRHDKRFIENLDQYQHLEFSVESVDGWHGATFDLVGFSGAYEPVREYCEE